MTPFTCANCGAEVRGFTHRCASPKCSECGSKLICPVCDKKVEKKESGREYIERKKNRRFTI